MSLHDQTDRQLVPINNLLAQARLRADFGLKRLAGQACGEALHRLGPQAVEEATKTASWFGLLPTLVEVLGGAARDHADQEARTWSALALAALACLEPAERAAGWLEELDVVELAEAVVGVVTEAAEHARSYEPAACVRLADGTDPDCAAEAKASSAASLERGLRRALAELVKPIAKKVRAQAAAETTLVPTPAPTEPGGQKGKRDGKATEDKVIAALVNNARLLGASERELAEAAGLPSHGAVNNAIRRIQRRPDTDTGRKLIETHLGERVVRSARADYERDRDPRSQPGAADGADLEAIGRFSPRLT